MSTKSRLGIDIVATAKGNGFAATRRSMESVDRSVRQIKGSLAGFAGANVLANVIRSFVEINRHVAPVETAINQMQRAWQAFALRVGDAGMNKALIDFAQRMGAMLLGTNGLADSIGRLLAGGIRILGGIFEGVGRAIGFVYDNFGILKQTFYTFAAIAIAQRVFAMAQTFVKLALAIRAGALVMSVYHLVQRRTLIVMAGMVAVAAKLSGKFEDLKAFMGDVWKTAEELVPVLGKDVVNALNAMGISTEAFTKDFGSFKDQLGSLPPLFDDIDKAQKKLTFNKNYDILDGNLKETSKQTLGLKDEFKSFFSEMGSGTKPLDALNSALGRLRQKLLDMALDNAFSLLQGLFGSAPVMPGVGPGGMGFLNFGGPRAGGGDVSRGKAYVVGEKRPELFIPGQSGTIVPSIPGPSSGGSGGNVYISNHGAQVDARPRERSDGGRDWEIKVRGIVANEMANPYSNSSVALGTRGARNPIKRGR